tara:strand:- start:23011 stop:23400 length:390 start_codon:yes stop_codon:yes gene_type:complete
MRVKETVSMKVENLSKWDDSSVEDYFCSTGKTYRIRWVNRDVTFLDRFGHLIVLSNQRIGFESWLAYHKQDNILGNKIIYVDPDKYDVERIKKFVDRQDIRTAQVMISKTPEQVEKKSKIDQAGDWLTF